MDRMENFFTVISHVETTVASSTVKILKEEKFVISLFYEVIKSFLNVAAPVTVGGVDFLSSFMQTD